jgi:hypothetical protein
MKQSAMQQLLEEVILEREKSISVEFRDALDFVITAIETDYKEIEKKQQGYSEEEVLDFLVGILDSTSTFIEFKNIKEWFNKNK